MPRWLVAVNRRAGRSAVDPAAVAGLLNGLGVDHEVVVPDSVAGMRAALLDGSARGVSHFALVGGDGTANLAVNVLMEQPMSPKPVMSILPAGTGCDLLRTFGLPQDLGIAARSLLTDEVYDIDVARIEGSWGSRYFVNVAQAGVGAAAVQTAPKVARSLGTLRYPMAFLARLPRVPPAAVRLTTEKRVYESEALAVILANGQFFAGGWNVAPRATLVDGVLDLQIINASKSRAPALVPKLIKGTHLDDRAVRRTSAAEFTLETEPPWPVEADGDFLGNTRVSGRVVPGAISLKL